MSNQAGGEARRSRDAWDKLSVLAGFLASVLVPLALGLVGHWYTAAIKDREVAIREGEFAREWVQLSLDILRDPGSAESLRRWAIEVVNAHSEVQMEQEVRTELIEGRSVLPSPVQHAAPSRADQVNALQTSGIRALLDRRIELAILHYDTAYEF